MRPDGWDLAATFALLMGAGFFVFAVLGLLAELIARRESSESPTVGAHSHRGDPAARLLSMTETQAERQAAARDRAINQILRDAGYPVDEELTHRGSRR